jgi:hypothetical protein
MEKIEWNKMEIKTNKKGYYNRDLYWRNTRFIKEIKINLEKSIWRRWWRGLNK